MKWCIIILLLCRIAAAFTISGIWRPSHYDVGISVDDETVYGIINDKQYIKMTIVDRHADLIQLGDIQLLCKPPDWYNIVKYKYFLDTYNKIKKHGIVCRYSVVDNDNMVVEPHIGDDRHRFILYRDGNGSSR